MLSCLGLFVLDVLVVLVLRVVFISCVLADLCFDLICVAL